MKHIGIDGCKAGWFYIRFDEKGSYDFGVLNSIKELPQITNPNSIVCIDIPIGLRQKDTQERLCDKEARKLLKKRGSSVFPAPSRLSLDASDYQAASGLNFKFTGRKLSRQSHAISMKIKEVDDFIQTLEKQSYMRECHPELCFLALNNFEPLNYSKKKKEGQAEREEILLNYLNSASKIVKEVSRKYLRKQVAIDDILDAMVAALTASFEGRVLTAPLQPEIDNRNLKMEIVYPYLIQSMTEEKRVRILKKQSPLLKL